MRTSLKSSFRIDRVQLVDVDGDVLILGQLVEMAGDASAEIELQTPRFIEDQRALVPDERLVSLAPDLRRTEQIVEVGVVQRDARAPVVPFVVGRGVDAFARWQVGVGAVARRQDESIQLQPIGEVESHPDGGRILVALRDRVKRFAEESASQMIHTGPRGHRVERNLRRRADVPGLTMGCSRQTFAEERDRADVLERRRLMRAGTKPSPE